MLLPGNIEVRNELCSYHPKKCFYFKDSNPPYYRAVEYTAYISLVLFRVHLHTNEGDCLH